MGFRNEKSKSEGWQRNFGRQRLTIPAAGSPTCSIYHTEEVLATFLLLSEPVADSHREPKPSLSPLGEVSRDYQSASTWRGFGDLQGWSMCCSAAPRLCHDKQGWLQRVQHQGSHPQTRSGILGTVLGTLLCTDQGAGSSAQIPHVLGTFPLLVL